MVKARTLLIVQSLQYGERLLPLMNRAGLDLELVGIEYNGALGLERFREYKPQLVILDAAIAIIGVDRYIELMESYTGGFGVVLLSDAKDAGLNNIRSIYKTIRKTGFSDEEFIDGLRYAAEALHKQVSSPPQHDSQTYQALTQLVGDGDFSAKKLYTLRDEYGWLLTPAIDILLPRPSTSLSSLSVAQLNEIRNILHSFNGGETLLMQDGVVCILVNEFAGDLEVTTERRYEQLLQQIRRVLGKEQPARFTIFGNSVKLNELKKKYTELRNFYDLGYFAGELNFVRPGAWSNRQRTGLEEIKTGAIQALADHLFEESYAAFSSRLQHFYLTVLKGGMDWEAVLLFRQQLELLAGSLQRVLPDKSAVDLQAYFSSAYQTIEEEYEALDQLFGQIHDRLHGNSIRLNQLTLRAIPLAIEHLAEDISLSWVAERIHIAPSYLSHVFKKDTGATFTDYLNRLRIILAKRLIGSKSMKMYEIAEKTGFSDYRYFSLVFRNITGMTPTDYQQVLEGKDRK